VSLSDGAAIKFLDVEGTHNDVAGTPDEDDFSVVA